MARAGIGVVVVALVAASTGVDAVVLCARQRADGTFNTSIKLRESCRQGEEQLDPVALVQGPPGPTGPQGPAGPEGPTGPAGSVGALDCIQHFPGFVPETGSDVCQTLGRFCVQAQQTGREFLEDVSFSGGKSRAFAAFGCSTPLNTNQFSVSPPTSVRVTCCLAIP
jgi:hypothetical protein